MALNLPEKFQEKIENNNHIKGGLHKLLGNFEDWLSDNSLEFFPEYTDHGVTHIQSVINTADEVIADEAWDIISAEDIYVLISSILLHDCAMHLSKSGLWSLLRSEQFNGVLLGFGVEDTWKEKWLQYEKQVNKYSESDWLNLFSDSQSIELPEIGSSNLDDNQKVLIGDFIRKYHANIAQIISVYGIPVKTGAEHIFDNNLYHLNELAGFVARSHNYSLRNMVDLIGIDERGRQYRNTHPCFLMGILRVADYLQFSVSRTPKILFKTKGVCSPQSVREWRKHFAILSTNKTQPDKELLFVNAYPEDAQTLVGVKQLLEGFQSELDEYWAVSGEVYSRYENLKSLAIIYRRVKSNIDDPQKYVSSNHKNFYPDLLRISSDEQKIYPLLVGPLYGRRPQIGLRELIQNALDACNERFSNQTGKDATKEEIPFSTEVVLNFDENSISIVDDGIGMDTEIIKNYFLRIGASYRYSEAWKKMHVVEGNSKVPRTGKFGIGMLAGFLLGTEITVLTRRDGMPENKGIEFKYNLTSSNIELRNKNKNGVGTLINISSTEEILWELVDGFNIELGNWKADIDDINSPEASFWYFFDNPKLNLKIVRDGEETIALPPFLFEKNTLFNDPTIWSRVPSVTELELYWRHTDKEQWRVRNNTFCNGIIVKGLETPKIELLAGGYHFEISGLEIVIVDKLNNFPLNLTRNELVIDGYYESFEIRKDVWDRLMAEMFTVLKDLSFSEQAVIELLSMPIFSYCDFLPFVFSKGSIVPIGASSLVKRNSNKLNIVDFIFQNQKRGLIYENDVFKLIDDFGYLAVKNVEKSSVSVAKVFMEYLVPYHKKADMRSYPGYYYRNELGRIQYRSWLYIRKYDFDKANNYELRGMDVNFLYMREIDDEWLMFCSHDDVIEEPELGVEIIKLATKTFMFVMCEVVDNQEDEFTKEWLSRDLPEEIYYKND